MSEYSLKTHDIWINEHRLDKIADMSFGCDSGDGSRPRMFITMSLECRLRTSDGRYVYVLVHPYWHCPTVYRDRLMTREIEDWFNDDPIGAAVQWFIDRGCRG